MESSPYWEAGAHPDFLLSVNEAMLQIRERLLAVAPTRVPVLLCGEKGIGKEALAHTVHQSSLQATGPFVRVNCYVVPRTQLPQEVFGYADGAVSPFTRARGGTLYLNGIETFDSGHCERLVATLKGLDGVPPEGAPRLVFSTETVELEGAGMKLLEEALRERAGLIAKLPPLRSRTEDIGLLAQHILQLYSPFYGSRIKQMRGSLIDLFKQYSWPGNVRELERLIRRFLVVEDETAIRRELEEKIWHGRVQSSANGAEFASGLTLSEVAKLAVKRAEAGVIRQVLERTRWNKKAAAQELGVSYKSLLNKVRDYQLDS